MHTSKYSDVSEKAVLFLQDCPPGEEQARLEALMAPGAHE